MEIYIIIETQNLTSMRKGRKIQVKNLTSAKRYATRNQKWNTTIEIQNEDGKSLSVKYVDSWVDKHN